MSVDGCEHSFEVLANRVLPTYMRELRDRMQAHPISMRYAASPGVGAVSLRERYGRSTDTPGCYVLTDAGTPVYVGISKAVFQRLVDHVKGSDHLTATLAYHIAKHRHPHGTTAGSAMRDPDFAARFHEAREYVRDLQAAYVAIPNPLELYLFEPYAALELGTGKGSGGWNTFITH